jgi:Cytochrome P450
LLFQTVKSNAATDLPPEERISDDDVLHNINTFMFVGTDSSSLSVTFTLLLLARHPSIQDRLRAELRSMARPENLGDEAVLAHYQELAVLPLLDKVCRESLRLVPAIHSTLRVATQDDVLPASKGENIHIRKGTFIHVPLEQMNLDREIWGENAWSFMYVLIGQLGGAILPVYTLPLLRSPDRWDNLPESVTSLPGVYANIMTFSGGPRVWFSTVVYDCVRDLTKIYSPVLHRPAFRAD